MERTANPLYHLPDLPKGWKIACHPRREQPYAVWRGGKVWRFEQSMAEAKEYVRVHERLRLQAAGVARGNG